MITGDPGTAGGGKWENNFAIAFEHRLAKPAESGGSAKPALFGTFRSARPVVASPRFVERDLKTEPYQNSAHSTVERRDYTTLL